MSKARWIVTDGDGKAYPRKRFETAYRLAQSIRESGGTADIRPMEDSK